MSSTSKMIWMVLHLIAKGSVDELDILNGRKTDEWETALPRDVLYKAASEIGCTNLEVIDMATIFDEGHWERFRSWISHGLDRPKLLRNAMDGWPILGWSEQEIAQRFGSLVVGVREAELLHESGTTSPRKTYTLLSDFLNRPQGLNVIFENTYTEVTRAVSRTCCNGSNALRDVIHKRPIFSVGHAGSGVGFHQHERNFLAQAIGRKVWFLASPQGDRPAIRQPCQYLLHPPPDTIACSVNPSEVLLVPDGVWHATCNVDETTLAVGWEGDSSQWSPVRHGLADCDHTVLDRHPMHTDELRNMIILAVETGNVASVEKITALTNQTHLEVDEDTEAGPMHVVASYGHVPVAELLLLKGVLVGTEKGWQPMHVAARSGHVTMSEFLLDRRASATAKTSASVKANFGIAVGTEPLHLSVARGHLSVAALLLSHSANAQGRTVTGEEPMHTAVENGHVAITELLVSHEVEAQEMDELVHISASLGHVPVLKFLVKVRSNLQNQEDGQAPIHIAAERGHSIVVELLVGLGASLETVNKRGQQPLHVASSSGKVAVAKLLVESKANLNAVDIRGRNPVYLANAAGHTRTSELLRELHDEL